MHLRKVHWLGMKYIIDDLTTSSHLGPGTGKFWCGFCRQVEIDSLGRLQHIENHLLGVSPTRKSLSEEWYPINSRVSRKDRLLSVIRPLRSIVPNTKLNPAPPLDNGPTPDTHVDAHSNPDSDSDSDSGTDSGRVLRGLRSESGKELRLLAL
jgi:hypothetical protein